jgi:hypothetical protein
VGENGEQPALGVGPPSVQDREQADGACCRPRFAAAGRVDRLQLAAFTGVDDVPPAFTQLPADRVGGGEIADPTALDALVEQSLSCGSIRSFWL